MRGNLISAVILTKNEKNNIRACLASLTWCSEIIVVDDFSTDGTIGLVRKFGKRKVRVFKRDLKNDFSSQRNFGLTKTKGEWVLFIDADETVSKSLEEEIIQKIQNEDIGESGFYIKRKDIWMGRELLYGETGNIKLLRLAKRNSGKWQRAVHEVWRVKGKIGELDNPIYHRPHGTVKKFVEDLNRYTVLHAAENRREKKNFNFLFVVFHPLGKFFVNYFLKLGFLDGTHGFVQAVFMSFHSFLGWSKIFLDK